jgi:site-specific DNA recombinase
MIESSNLNTKKVKNNKAVAVIYTRVSSLEQVDNTSLEQQEEICRDYCARKGYEVAKVFIEQGESAKYVDRTELQKSLLFCSDKKNCVDFFIVYKYDRFSRSLENHVYIKATLSRYGVGLQSVTEPIDDSPSGRLMENILAGFAQFDNEIRTERSINGMKSKLMKGDWIYHPPTGYTKDKSSIRKPKPVIPHPFYFEPMKEAWLMFATGNYKISEIIRFLEDKGVKSESGKLVNFKSISKIFRNKFYKGLVYSDGFSIEVKGNHVPMIDDLTFQTVQELLDQNKNNKIGKVETNPDFYLAKTLRCFSCNNILTGCYSKGKIKYYGYYQCGNSQCKQRQYLPKDKIHETFLKFLENLIPPKEDLDLFKDILIDVYTQNYQYAIEVNLQCEKMLKGLNKKLNKIKEMLEESVYSQEEYLERKSKIEAEIINTKIQITNTEIDKSEFEKCINDSITFIEHLPKFWINLSHLNKQKLHKILFGEGIIYDNGTYRTPSLNPIFNEMQTFVEEENSNMTLGRIELPFTG